MAAAFACERRRLRRLSSSRRHQSGFDVGCRLRRRVSSSSSSSSSSAREERSAESDDDDDTRAKHLLLRRLREQLQQQKQHKQRENDDKEDDDDVRFVCVALSDDEGAFFSSSTTTTTTTMDSLDDDAPGTFAVLLSSPLRFCSSEKEEEDDDEEEARRLCWTRVELKSTKRLKEDAISSLRRAVSTERRTKNDAKEKEEENRLVAVAYKPLAIGARKKAFRDAEKYFEETFSVSLSSSSSTTSEEKVENGRGSGDDSSSRSSSSSPSSSTRGLFSSEDVKQLETYGFVVLDGVVPEQAVRQMYEHAESLADKLFPVDQDGRDDDLASIKIDIDNPAASPLNLAGTFLWSLPRKLCEAASASSSPPPNCALAARARAENTALDKFAQLAKYDKRGARYDPHVDYDHNNSDGPEGSRISERNLTAILYFNVGYANEAEGCLRVFLDDREEENRAPVAAAAAAAAAATLRSLPSPQKYVDVEPLPGRLVVFDSRRILHGVMPSYRRRWAITVWS